MINWIYYASNCCHKVNIDEMIVTNQRLMQLISLKYGYG